MNENSGGHIIEAASSISDPEKAIVTMADVEALAKAAPSIESSYRRGYCQGYFYALEAIRSGIKEHIASEFLGQRLYAWRYAKHGGKFQEPPILSLTKDGSMRLEDYTSQDGFTLEVGQFVRIAPQAFDRRHYMTGKVIEPGKKSSLVEPANHKKGEWVENRYLTLHKAKNTNRGILFSATIQKDPMSKPQLKIANTYSPEEIVTAHAGEVVTSAPEAKTAATADDFDALANLANRLRESAHAKLMKLSDDERTAKALLADAQSRIAAHMNQCRALGIDMGATKEAKAG